MKMSLQQFVFAASTAAALTLGTAGCTAGMKADSASAAAATAATGNREPSGFELIRHQYKKGEIKQLCDAAIKSLTADLKKTKDLYDLDLALSEFGDATTPLAFMGYVNQNAQSRSEASACEEAVGKKMVEVFTNRELYQKVKGTKLKSPKDTRFQSEMALSFEKNGMALSDGELDRLKKLKTELAGLESQFSKNLNEDTTSVEFAEKELDGVPESFLKSLKKSTGGTYVVTTKSTDYLQVMENAKSPDTRKKMMQAYESRAGVANSDLMKKAVALRADIAKLMGYKTWADYRIEGRMAKNAATALGLLSDLEVKLRPRLQKDLQILLNAKKQIEDPKATALNAWDLSYFANQVKKRDYSLDDEVLRDYFPKDHVMDGLFNVYSTLLGVTFEEVKDASVWAPEVKLYATKDKKSGDVLAYFYTDFVPREGKYGHAASFTLIQGRMLPAGHYNKPVSAIVSNFTPPSGDRPSLLTHDEVDTLFHEFGHIMHQILTTVPYGSMSGTSVAQDFVEAPSQMLENWVWDAKILRMLSGHYKTGKQLPSKMIKQMIAARDFNQGYFYERQIVLGKTDLALHMSSSVSDVNDVYSDMYRKILTVEPLKGTHWMAGFGHLMGGYDAGYYGYIWSEVFAADMFTAFKKGGLLSPNVGARYRRIILGKGNMEEAYQLVTEFLGREPNNKAFLKKLGL